MSVHRLNHSFTAGELSPLMFGRTDFDKYKNGCETLENMYCAPQGPAIRRSGTKYIDDLVASLDMKTSDPRLRMIPFIFSESQAYVMIFYICDTDDDPHMVLAKDDSLVMGLNSVVSYETESNYEYLTGSNDYSVSYDSTHSLDDVTVTYTEYGGDTTDLVEGVGASPGAGEDFTWVDPPAAAGTAVVTVNIDSFTPGTPGYLTVTLELTSVAIATTSYVDLVLPTDWDIEDMDWAQSADEMYFAQSGFAPAVLTRYAEDTWVLSTIPFVDVPSTWGASNYPQRVTFHQQRLVFAATVLRPKTVWMSKAGSFWDFGVSSTVVDSDAVTFTLDSGTQNKILWMNSSKSLHIGTVADEWTVTGATRESLTPSNILAQRQTNSGSEAITPLMVGLTTLFIERHGRVVSEFVYDYTYDSYKTSDLAILSPHVTEVYSIVDWTYQQTPGSIIWAVRSDGTLLGLTYQRQHKVVGWHRHTTEGEFKVITSIPGSSRADELWVVVKRTIDSTVGYFVEKFTEEFKGTTAAEGRFLDSQVVQSGAATDTMTGLDHLIGESVDVLADGTVHPACTVDVAGEITLNADYSVIVAGLGYTSEVRPLMSEVEADNGTSAGRTQRIINVIIDIYRSLGMKVGRYGREDGEDEETIPFRVPTDLTGVAVPLYSGFMHLDFPEGYDRDLSYYIQQDQPLPLTVRRVVDVVEVFE